MGLVEEIIKNKEELLTKFLSIVEGRPPEEIWPRSDFIIRVELRNKGGEDSGLLTTKSQIWVHYPVNCKELIIIPVPDLKRLAGEYICKVGIFLIFEVCLQFS